MENQFNEYCLKCAGFHAGFQPNSVTDWPSLQLTYNFIDLGLPSGTKWADCNLGASSPEESGLYFAAGETTGYSADLVGYLRGLRPFAYGDYKYSSNWFTGAGTVTFYTTLTLQAGEITMYVWFFNNGEGITGIATAYEEPEVNDMVAILDTDTGNIETTGIITSIDGTKWTISVPTTVGSEDIYDDSKVLLPEYDAATFALGNSYRMPSKEQAQELIANTTVSADTVNDVKGVRFTNKVDATKSIFIPLAGYCEGVICDLNSFGYLWLSTYADSVKLPNYLYLNTAEADTPEYAYVYSYPAFSGFTIRPVQE